MTIYTPNSGDKKEEKEYLTPEVVVDSQEPLATKKKDVLATPTLVTVGLHRRRRSNLANVCVLLTALAVFATGIIGGIYLYRHLVHRTFRGYCGVRYTEGKQVGQFEEYIELDKEGGSYEKIDVPEFQDCKRATVLHDFDKNLTAIIDKDRAHCFVLPLNRTMTKPPKNLWDLVSKLRSGYYLPDTEIVREKYRVLTPAVQNLRPYGFYIWKQCMRYDTYKLIKEGEPYALTKREACDHLNYYLGDAGTERSLVIEAASCA